MGAHPLLIPNVKGRSQCLGARSTEMEGGSKDPVIPSMTWNISDGETAPEIRCRPSSMTSANIRDGNKRSHPAYMKAVIKHTLDGRRLGIRDPPHPTSMYRCPAPLDWSAITPRSESIYPVIGDAGIHADTTRPSNNYPQLSYTIDRSTHTTTTTTLATRNAKEERRV